jgi:hypothetical protein
MNNFELNQNVIVVDAMGNDDIAFGDEGVIFVLPCIISPRLNWPQSPWGGSQFLTPGPLQGDADHPTLALVRQQINR